MGVFSPDTITDFVRRGDLEGVKRRLELGDNVNECRSFQRTPLLEAALYNHCAIIELLLDHGADMELIDSCDFTALHKAIERRSVEAALLLTRRGADANKVGYRDQTPLQTAVLRDLFDVTAELLRQGADPTIRNNGNYRARDFVQRGLNHDKFIKLLDAYTDLKSAIGAMNEDAITVWLRKALTGIPTSTISGIEAAIVLMRTDAMCAILQATLARGDFDDMVQKHKSMENGIRDASDADWHKSLVVAGDDYKMKWLEKVILSQDFGQLLTFIESVASPDWMQSVLFNNGWTPLHYAASLGNSAFVQYLLVECGLNPLALSSDNKTARDLAVEAGSSNGLSWMLQRHMKKRTFSDHSALLLLCWKEVTVDGLQQLLGQLTSVYNLRIIFSLGCQALTPDEMHGILTEVFDEVIREKLVFDDHAALFSRWD